MSPTQLSALEQYMDARSTQTIDQQALEDFIAEAFEDAPAMQELPLAELSFLLYDYQEAYGHTEFSAHDIKHCLKEQFGF